MSSRRTGITEEILTTTHSRKLMNLIEIITRIGQMLATLSLEWVASMHLESDKGQTLEQGDKGLDQEVPQVPDTMTAATTTIPKCTQQPNQAQESNMVMMKDQLT